jgi:hypothetical protein
MTSHERNTHPRAVVALLLAAVLAVVLQACGGGQQNAQSIVNATFNSRQQINSGKLNLAFNLDANGLQGVSSPIAVQVTGPFQSTSPTKLPRFALNIDLGTGGHALKAGAISTAGQFFVTLAGEAFVAPAATRNALQSSYAQASKAASSHKSVSTFASLGLDPGHWLEHPVRLGTQETAGVETIHISAGLNLARFLADADKLSGASGSLGIAQQQVSGLLSPGESHALVSSLTSARVDLYTGASDHLLRSLTVHAALSSNAANRKLLQGLRSATLNLRLQITNLNESQKITAPGNPRPLSDLVSALQQQGLVSPNQASSSGEASSTPGSTSDSSSAYARCAESAGQSVVALQKCASLLKG